MGTAASFLEAWWTGLALIGAVLSGYMAVVTWQDRRLYLRRGEAGRYRSVRAEIANRELRTSLAFLLIELLYVVAGLAAMAAPNPPPAPEANELARSLVVGALMASSLTIIVVKAMNIASRRRVRKYFERNDE